MGDYLLLNSIVSVSLETLDNALIYQGSSALHIKKLGLISTAELSCFMKTYSC